jgi:hypothetical protein
MDDRSQTGFAGVDPRPVRPFETGRRQQLATADTDAAGVY